MQQFKEHILASLNDLKCSGRFLSVQTADFVFSGLDIAGRGEIAFPVNDAGATAGLLLFAGTFCFSSSNSCFVETAFSSVMMEPALAAAILAKAMPMRSSTQV